MRLAITGGGTGGHIYPALEVGLACRELGVEILYVGSFRGQEKALATERAVDFRGVESEPLWSLRTLAGWRSAVKLLRSTTHAKSILREWNPDVLFSTGGYSAAPFMQAARSLRIPYVIHEANSVPGRANRLYSKRAEAFTYVFRYTSPHAGPRGHRTGQPVRSALCEAAYKRERQVGMRHVLVLGGSQGARFVNAIVLEAAKECSHLSFTVATGPALIEEARAKSGDAQNVRLVPYLSGSELIDAYVNADLFIGRSGGTLAEVAKFRLPSVLIPLPTSADHHQLFNAAEFESDGAARVLWQGGVSPIGHGGATAATLIEAIRSWDAESETQAAAALEAWDVPDATDRIRSFIIKN